ncbi:hypothetical protein A3A67_00970 [Candidatus Peribacteria bacterium RIFCSPLOWO2_01_FULL_51_18]|nr:MAG: hypothetical protein A3A67_00970 [Candidatus Peribacteria bacterium RIFCSPLOWO2_01_FULL_51_18]
MKRSFIAVFAVFLLAGCGSGNNSSTKVTCEQQFWNGNLAACLPKGWKILSEESLRTMGIAEETVAAFQFDTPHAGQLDTITVTLEPLSQDMKTGDYSDANIQAVSALPDYKLIDKITSFIDGQETAVHVFSARSSPDLPIRRYYQLSAVKEKTGYTFTGSFPLSIEPSEADQVLFILKNISFADPGSEKKE